MLVDDGKRSLASVRVENVKGFISQELLVNTSGRQRIFDNEDGRFWQRSVGSGEHDLDNPVETAIANRNTHRCQAG